jgi:hypothetical protein
MALPRLVPQIRYVGAPALLVAAAQAVAESMLSAITNAAEGATR